MKNKDFINVHNLSLLKSMQLHLSNFVKDDDINVDLAEILKKITELSARIYDKIEVE